MKKFNLFSHLTVAFLIMAMGAFTFAPNFSTPENGSLTQHSNNVVFAHTITDTAQGIIGIPTSIVIAGALFIGAIHSAASACHHARTIDLDWSGMTEKEFEMNLLP